MIRFVVPEDGRFGIENYQRSRWRSVASVETATVSFDELFESQTLAGGTWVFSSIECLTPAGVRLAQHAWSTLTAAGSRVLNRPDALPDRLGLSQRLFDAGINQFRTHRADRLPSDVRYPVFVREADAHTGNLSPLLDNRRQLEGALRWQNLHGRPPHSLLVVEFCDTSDTTGLFRKYSAFYVAGTVVARHLHFDRKWMVKAHAPDPLDAWADEEYRYIRDNPHAAEVARIFEIAGIDYGRIDYGLLGERVQVWEINTNPTFGPGPHGRSSDAASQRFRDLQAPGKRLFYDRFEECLSAIDSVSGAEVIPFTPPPQDLLAYAKERREHARIEARVRRRAALASHLPLGLIHRARSLVTRGD